MQQMSDYLKLKPAHLRFIYKIDELTIDAYLAANKKTDMRLVEALQAAFLKVKQKIKGYLTKGKLMNSGVCL